MKKPTKNTHIIIAIILTILLCLYYIFIRGIYCFSDEVVDVYENVQIYETFLPYEPWQIGANKYGEPIFCYKENALQYTKTRYKDLLNKVYETHNISRLNKSNVTTYKELLMNIKTKDETEKTQIKELIMLLELYENGQKRWIYVVGKGFDRICIK